LGGLLGFAIKKKGLMGNIRKAKSPQQRRGGAEIGRRILTKQCAQGGMVKKGGL